MARFSLRRTGDLIRVCYGFSRGLSDRADAHQGWFEKETLVSPDIWR